MVKGETIMNELSLYILDVALNSIEANSKNVRLIIEDDDNKKTLSLTIEDDGKGMDEKVLQQVKSPFYTTRTTRKVGFGLAFLEELARLCGGDLKIESKENVGTKLSATFISDHIDLPPMGNLSDTMYALITNDKGTDIEFKYCKNGKVFGFSTKEIKKILDGVPLTDSTVMIWFKDFFKENMKELFK